MRGRPFTIYLILTFCGFGIVNSLAGLIVAAPTFMMGGFLFGVVLVAFKLVMLLWLLISVYFRNNSAAVAAFVLASADVGLKLYAVSKLQGADYLLIGFGFVLSAINVAIFLYLYASIKKGGIP